MSQRITCPRSCNDSALTVPSTVYNLRDDFKIEYNFVNSNYTPALKIPLESFDLTITYYIKGREERYIVEKLGMHTTNCVVYPDRGILKAIFKDHGLKPGYLYAELEFTYFDPESFDRTRREVVSQYTGIILKESEY